MKTWHRGGLVLLTLLMVLSGALACSPDYERQLYIATDYWIAYEFTLVHKGDVLEGELSVLAESGDITFYITDTAGDRLLDKGITAAGGSCRFRMEAPVGSTKYILYFAGQKGVEKQAVLSYSGTAEPSEYQSIAGQTTTTAHLSGANLKIEHYLPQTNPWYDLYKDLTNEFLDVWGEIYCNVKISDAPPGTQLMARWVFVEDEYGKIYDEQIHEESVIVAGDMDIDFTQPVKTSAWRLGNYEVRLYLNGEEKTTLPFEIVAEEQKLDIHWMKGLKTGVVEGTVKNVGNVPLDNVQFEASFYNEDGELIRKASSPVDLGTTAVVGLEGLLFPGGTGHCLADVLAGKIEGPLAGETLYSYKIRFFLLSGETVPHNDNWDFSASGLHLLED